MYEEALRIGCRCVELDCWDGPNNEPKITHGYTLTSSLTMSSVIKTISEFAFKSSPYPVILSLEMHCKKPQQKVAAQILSEHLGIKNIYMLPDDLEDYEEKNLPYFPSPEELKFKYIIKCKCKRRVPQCFRDLFTEEEMKEYEPGLTKQTT